MVQETTTTSWGKRIINAFWGIIIGIVLIIGGIVLIFWNEGHALHVQQSLEQVSKIVVPTPNSPIDAKNEMKVVYLSGPATTKDILHDKLFNISINAIQLDRKVVMYQWQEDKETSTEKQVGGSEQQVTTYNYKQVWSADLIDSTSFKEANTHKNPARMPIKSLTQFAKTVSVGDFKLPENLITQITGDKSIYLDETIKINTASLEKKFNKPVHVQEANLDSEIYFGTNSESPQIGDMRVTITDVPPNGIVSIIAQQSGDKLQPFMADSGQSVSLIEMGNISWQEMIHHAESQNMLMLWILRLISLALLMFGFALIMKPLSVLADVVPFVGNLVGFGTGLIAFILGLICWALFIAVAWFTVRPLLAISFFIFVSILCILFYKYKTKHS